MAEANFTRVCTCCNKEFPATREYFHAYKRAPDGCRAVCRACRAKDHADNREERLNKKREHWLANKERLLAASRNYYAENIEAQRAAGRRRHWKNRDVRIVQMQQYRKENIEAINSKKRVRGLEKFHARYGVDLDFTLKHRVRGLIRTTLSNGRSGKRMKEILGYSTDELKNHLQSLFTDGMTWELFMSGLIHIDHIIPVSAFKIESEDSDDFMRCWALSNLQPLWAKDNLSKGSKLGVVLGARMGHKLR